MTVTNILILIFATVLAMSFGWGMRGDLIGGEEGAMLPGALLGLVISAFIGLPYFEHNALYFVSLGIVGMFFGGTEPYAQCFELTYWGDGCNPKPKNIKKGLIGLSIKGAAWFGICAAVMSIGFIASTGSIYKWYEIAILVVALPIMRFAGTRTINYPREVKKNHLPKLYFSRTSPEEWGGLWFIIITLISFIMYHKDSFSLKITAFGMLGGSLGWIIAQLIHCFTRVRMKNGRYLFGNLQEKGRIDNWKIMEFIFGALGGLSITLGFLIERPTALRFTINDADNYSIWSPLESILGYDFSTIAPAIWFALFLIDSSTHLIRVPEKIKKRSLFSRYLKLYSLFHRPILCYIPMALIILGSIKTAQLMVFVVLFWQAAEELCFVQLKSNSVNNKLISFLFYLCLIILSILSWSDRLSFKIKTFFIIVSVFYIILAAIARYVKYKCDNKLISTDVEVKSIIKTGSFTFIYLYYLICVIVVGILLYTK